MSEAPKPQSDDEFITLARNRFKIAVDTFSSNRVSQLDDVKFAAGSPDNGWQWPEQIRNARLSPPNKGAPRPCLTNNVLPQHIHQVTNEQRQNRPAGKVIPVDDKGDIEVAEIFNGIVRHIEVRSHADVAYDGACEAQVTSGEGFWRLLTEYVDDMNPDEQDICIEAIRNQFSVYMEPDGLRRDSTGRKCEWTFITDRLTTDDYKRQFPNAKSKVDWDNLGLGDDTFEWFDDKGVMIAEYFYCEYEKKKICRMSDGSVIVKSANYVMPPGLTVVAERETELRRVKWAKINGMEKLEEKDWAGKYIPVIRVAGNEYDVEGQIVVTGIVRNAKDPQRMLNYWTSQEAEMLALAPKAPFIGAVGQFASFSDEWGKANEVPYSRLEYDPLDVNGIALPPPQRQQPVLPPMGIVNAKLGSADDLKAVTGQFDPSLGNNPQSKSGIALQREQRKTEVGTFHYIDNLSRSIGFSTEQLVDLIPKIYDTKRIARIIGEDGEPDHAILCPGQGCAVKEQENEAGEIEKIYDPSVGRYDVVVKTGPSFTTARQEAAEFLGNALNSAKDPVTAQVLTYLSLKTSDWSGATEAADMMKRLLPAEIKSEEDDQNSIDAQKEKIRMAVQQIGQREAELNDHAEQLQMASDQAKQESEQAQAAEQRAKDAIAKVQTEIAKLNELYASIENEKELLELRRQLAQKDIEIQSSMVESERAVARAEAATIQARMEKKLEEINCAMKDVCGKLDEFEVAATEKKAA